MLVVVDLVLEQKLFHFRTIFFYFLFFFSNKENYMRFFSLILALWFAFFSTDSMRAKSQSNAVGSFLRSTRPAFSRRTSWTYFKKRIFVMSFSDIHILHQKRASTSILISFLDNLCPKSWFSVPVLEESWSVFRALFLRFSHFNHETYRMKQYCCLLIYCTH